MEQRHEQGRAIDHGRVDDLPTPGALRLPEGCEHTDDEEHRPAAVIADQVEWRCRRLMPPCRVRKDTGDGDVVQVMARGVRPGTILTPPGHAAVDKRGTPGPAGIGTEAQTLHHAGSEAFDEHIRARDEIEHDLTTLIVSYVDDDAVASPSRHVTTWIADRESRPRRLDADALSAEVRQDHRGEGRRTEPGHLHEAHALEWPGHRMIAITWELWTASRPSGVHNSRLSVE